MQNFDDQTERIRLKLLKAKQSDSEFKVFGAAGHKYILLDPVSEDQVYFFERTYAIKLPDCYRSFITKVGNGGINSLRSAAGPNYGIFPLGEKADFLISRPEIYLRNVCQIVPGMTDEDWDALTARVCSDEPISDEEYEIEMGKIFGGILPLGSQGCTLIHGLIITGPHAGRIAHLDVSLSKPIIDDNTNFLDWYEQWLDDVISGKLP